MSGVGASGALTVSVTVEALSAVGMVVRRSHASDAVSPKAIRPLVVFDRRRPSIL